jgi:hypothetical protein
MPFGAAAAAFQAGAEPVALLVKKRHDIFQVPASGEFVPAT